MAWKTLAPPKAADKENTVKVGTTSRRGWLYGIISFGGNVGERMKIASRCSVAVDEDARQIQVVFGSGEFKVSAFSKGGGRIILPNADWLPPVVFKALPCAIDSITGNQMVIQLPDAWPEVPVAE